MPEVRNLFNLHRERQIYLEETGKLLKMKYELGSIPSKQKEVLNTGTQFTFNIFKGELELQLVRYNTLVLTVTLEDEDKDLLWRISLVLSYLLADNVTILFHNNDFPFSAIPKNFNLGGGCQINRNRKHLFAHPVATIEHGLARLKESHFFRKMLLPMLQINTLAIADVRFMSEYALIEHLSKTESVKTSIVDKRKESANWSKLNSIIENTVLQIEELGLSDSQKKALKRKLTPGNINNKGVTKDRVQEFLKSLGKGFGYYLSHVHAWNHLRNNKGLVHGASLSPNHTFTREDVENMNRLHDCLCDLMYKDFSLSSS